MQQSQSKRKFQAMFKRVKERSVQMAVEKVEEWRHLFENGKVDNQGNLKKLTLQQAAEEVGIPKKTLEDYYQLIKKAKEIQPIEQLYDHKMGYLRQLIKQSQNFKQNAIEIETEEQKEVYSSDDEDIPYQNQQTELDYEDYFNLENQFNYDQNSLVMVVQTIPQITLIHPKKSDPWENETLSCDSGQETDDEDF
ncbi:unnamed protein product (macronuclear) [Paramecium tetraurelia]|uniref:HTH psq-type domain-containing protein n=1 Tax=Paramecium tetraurelia TaxID=5888 RepID=A0C7R4_PARTE|nr:uncharacterized protein GSPATT00035962001 [Paramecium tetraurelia]CAK66831.1 unnamed protein product [Paramecium tetraurelia]|eukprot:XP_001434228.1 hypothetical protein (macronuclear) [Paramecium tetraurelia strain d4-2]